MERYALAGVIGLAGLFALGITWLWRERPFVRICLLGVVCLLLVERSAWVVKVSVKQALAPVADSDVFSYPVGGAEILRHAIAKGMPIAVVDYMAFLELSHYASPQIAPSLFYLADPSLAAQYTSESMFDAYAAKAEEWFPIRGQTVEYRKFISNNRHFFVYRHSDRSNWLEAKLLDDGVSPAVVKRSGQRVLYEVVLP